MTETSCFRLSWCKIQSDSKYVKPIRFAMELSSSVIPPRGALRLVAVLVMCCSILVHISAIGENMEGQRGEDQNVNRVSADGAKTGEKQSLLNRERRAVKKNATPNTPDIEKRLKALEERCLMICRIRYQFSNLK